jgi:hypothetical protein
MMKTRKNGKAKDARGDLCIGDPCKVIGGKYSDFHGVVVDKKQQAVATSEFSVSRASRRALPWW